MTTHHNDRPQPATMKRKVVLIAGGAVVAATCAASIALTSHKGDEAAPEACAKPFTITNITIHPGQTIAATPSDQRVDDLPESTQRAIAACLWLRALDQDGN